MKHLTHLRQRGFTLLELAFLFAILGILVSVTLPTLSTLHEKSMQEEDRRTVNVLKEAIIGRFLATGQLPACKDAAGAPATGNCDTFQSLGQLGVRLKDARNNDIRYDVSGLVSATTKATVCTVLDTAILSEAGGTQTGYPRTCALAPNPDDAATFANYCLASTTTAAAFTLVATGRNRDGTNGEIAYADGVVSTKKNQNFTGLRTFEHPARRHYDLYDDVVEVVTLDQLRAQAAKICP